MTQTNHQPVPLLYLDVDGPIAPSGGQPSYAGEVRWADLSQGRMHFPVAVLDRLVSLHARGMVRVEWLTSWQDDASRYLAPALGLPDWPAHLRVSAPRWYECPVPTDWWKERVVVAALEAGERVIWCDDDIRYRAHQDLAHYADRLLMISPESATGLTTTELDRIEAWATGTLPTV